MKKNYIKSIIHKIKFLYQMSEIWDDVKIYIRDELKSGEIIDILKVNKRKFYTCAPGYPAEYCSKENLEGYFYVKTSTGDEYIIHECCFGLDFEAPCEKTEFSIYNANNELLYTTNESKKSKMLVIE